MEIVLLVADPTETAILTAIVVIFNVIIAPLQDHPIVRIVRYVFLNNRMPRILAKLIAPFVPQSIVLIVPFVLASTVPTVTVNNIYNQTVIVLVDIIVQHQV
jgi:hypothetical protein